MRVDYNGRMADVYDLGRSLNDTTVSRWMEVVAPHIPVGHQAILDLGAGTGRFSSSLARRFGGPVIALEPATAMRAHAIGRNEQGRVCHLAGSAQAIPIRASSVRAAWASQVLHHVEDLPAAGSELNRVLAPGGRLLVRGMYSDLPGQWPLVRFFPGLLRVGTTRFPSWSDIRSGLESGGLTLIASERVEQVIAGGLRELHERTRHRADSGLELLDDREFDEGLGALAEAARSEAREPVRERLDLFVFGGSTPGSSGRRAETRTSSSDPRPPPEV
ncbi:MAG: class I SAM-dependent methyltransferase [Acidimicrobiales bacterium]